MSLLMHRPLPLGFAVLIPVPVCATVLANDLFWQDRGLVGGGFLAFKKRSLSSARVARPRHGAGNGLFQLLFSLYSRNSLLAKPRAEALKGRIYTSNGVTLKHD